MDSSDGSDGSDSAALAARRLNAYERAARAWLEGRAEAAPAPALRLGEDALAALFSPRQMTDLVKPLDRAPRDCGP